jgi:hypothetical protein
MRIIPITINNTPMVRLIADEGKALTNGIDVFSIIDVADADAWSEVSV